MNEKPKKYLNYALIVRSDLDDAGLSDKAFRLLGHLARRQGVNPDAGTLVETIATHLKWDRKKAYEALAELKLTGWLSVRRMGSRCSRYSVLRRLNDDGTPYVPKNGTSRISFVPKSGTSDVPSNGTTDIPIIGTSYVPENGTQKGYVLRGSKEGNPKEGGGSTPASAFPSGTSQGKGTNEHQRWEDFTDAQRARFTNEAGGSEELAKEIVGIWHSRETDFGGPLKTNEDAYHTILGKIKDARKVEAKKADAGISMPRNRCSIRAMVVGSDEIKEIDPAELTSNDKNAPLRYVEKGQVHGNGLPIYHDRMTS